MHVSDRIEELENTLDELRDDSAYWSDHYRATGQHRDRWEHCDREIREIEQMIADLEAELEE
jgi:DNA repair exonuclease SbcCD ATPase subunit